MTLWTDSLLVCIDTSEEAEQDAIFDLTLQLEEVISRVLFTTQIERALLRRRLELARLKQQAWEYRSRFDMTYQAGIEQVLHDRIAALRARLAAHGLPN